MIKEVDYKDEAGRRFRVRVPEGWPEDKYHQGVLVGPPSLAALELPLDLEVRLNNQLHSRRLFTRADVLKRPQDVFGALQATYRTDTQRLQQLYLDEQGG